ncbi:Superfamily II DNA or RNA helicase [Halomicronema hongdechloris C2206]|uniref:Superfamily II DNA or RNA helicase n=1 Tax=Halomicronema hongdechloris C2206 TaxID=1641165 RepID=A0A1Z3HJB0_9CYAN|nr:helicase-related protein [Halomicronema hongdechloris]ASC70356.1 Superfamily II DNA or RNA helicase [Halomicronema hongdechloris C2206]
MTFAVGSLVKARDREWVVLPESTEEMLILRPLGGTEDEVTGIFLPLEPVEPAQFELPDPKKLGDYRSCRMLRDAVRLGFRSSAGPFRSFAKLAVEPRPYQLVPLLMALKLEPVRLLIADDVGIGKTVEACLVAKELMDRGEVDRLAVLCPPHLAEQWQSELKGKFHIDAELVLPSTATRLERNCRLGQSLFDLYAYVIVSTDFIKSEHRRDEFLRTCPELVIVDEAHTCAFAGEGRGGKHQRHQLIKGLADAPDRHLILVTATPHSGKEAAFRSLLALLNPDFADLPDELGGKENEPIRRQVAAHFVQRRRGDIRSYLDADTPFPERLEADETYSLSPEYKKLFDRILNYARETVQSPDANSRHRQRVRWWSALGLLRSLASSPAAAATTLRNRADTLDTETPEEADEVGRRTVMDLMDDDAKEGIDIVPGADISELEANSEVVNRGVEEAPLLTTRYSSTRLKQMAREAENLKGSKDAKLQKIITLVKDFLKNGFQPIIFCRFIPTAEYVAEELRSSLRNVEVVAVTGTLPPAEREERVEQLAESPQRVLVCTDCLSEGINLQAYFNAVIHYDLSWNPTRHEQREGRVDRYGQPQDKVRVLTYYGVDNQIDGIVLDVLIRKHRSIRSSLGISVPVPVDTDQVVEAIFEGLLLREQSSNVSDQLSLFDQDFFKPQKDQFFSQWEAASEREKRSRTMFAQETIKVEDVVRELQAIRSAIGSSVDVASFTEAAFKVHQAVVSETPTKALAFDLSEAPQALKDAIGGQESFQARFELPIQDGQLYLNRTHPIVEGLATHVMDTALDPMVDSVARRCGVIRTNQVSRRTTLLLTRFRFHIIAKQGDEENPLLAEDCQILAFTGSPEKAEWLEPGQAEKLLTATPDGNISADQATTFLQKVIDQFDHLSPHLETVAQQRGNDLLEAHRRVRSAAKLKGVRYRVEPQLPPDVLGIYMFMPVPKT